MNNAAHSPPRPPSGAGDSVLAIGLMSGTSVDGIDGVLVSLEAPPGALHQIAIEATVNLPFPAPVQDRLNALTAQTDAEVDLIGRLHSRLGHLYAQAANRLKRKAGGRDVAVIGCHGQTIRHRPGGPFPFTWQLGNGALIAHLTGLPVVTDFRSADMAAGGQGAPLAPAFHRAIFSSSTEHRALVNLGGIANITCLPAAGGPVTGFDTGPANTLLDHWCRRHFDAPFDDRGARAAAGSIHRPLLDALLSDRYFAKPPPKSTGREYFNREWLERILAAEPAFAALAPADVLATLTLLTARSVARQLNHLTPAVDRVYACGGGVRNRTLMAMLGEHCRSGLRDTSELGIDPQWVEACAFAWMAHQSVRRIPSTLPSVTGARKMTIAGAVYFPDV